MTRRVDPVAAASAEGAPGALPAAPARREQVGHAPQPWARWTLVATAICWAREARSAVAA
ncbi:hypothetical protein SBD_6948 [Streptomyces bottropensis ATCC 25435]|uniref:Uncharacterized protein n=1 Tax=Streptomyces bottropensis ATCC 25435 TaxID=1054862 RepID=M3EQE0_9ACTN|nr:hypothetical protein SBD_6948 [Streptomyces bottropensis ATCC 25435]